MAGTDTNYAASVEVLTPASTSFDAVARQMDKWWTATIDGQITKVGDTIRVVFPPSFGFWSFWVTNLVPDRLIELTCTDAHHSVAGQPEEIDREWVGTRVEWIFEPTVDGSRISMTHHGLTPQLNCWDICLDGWDYFFRTSLKSFLEDGQGTPHTG